MASPMVLAVGDVELHVTVGTEVSLQPGGLSVDLVQDSEEQLLCGHWSIEDAHPLFIRDARVSPCLD
jgi:hypothetical protein